MNDDKVFFEDDYDDEYFPRSPRIICTECNGTGIAVEGWDCEYCDGCGDFDF